MSEDILYKLRRIGSLKTGDPMPSDLGPGVWGMTISKICMDGADEIERLRGILEFVSTDPCFNRLGTVTQDRVKGVPLED